MSDPFGGPKAKRNANLVLQSILAGNDPDTWNANYWGDDADEPISVSEYESLKETDKAWDKVLKKLGIKNYNSTADKAKVFRYVSGGGSGSGSGKSDATKDPKTGAPRDTGKFDDIKDAFEEDRLAGEAMAKELAELKAKLGTIDPKVQAQLDSLTLANTGLTNDLLESSKANEQALADKDAEWAGRLDEVSASYDGRLNSLSASYEEKLAAAATASNTAIGRLEDLMMQQQISAMQTQQLLTSQLQSTQSALASQQRMSANLATAYVPQAEASAQSVVYGDTRQQKRKTKDNSLSDLSIVSGVTSSNSTSGLQVAG